MILNINIYGLLYCLSFIIGLSYVLLNYKKLDTSKKELFFFGVFVSICGILGSRIFSFLFRLPEAFESFENFKALLFSGFMFYGGLLGGIIGLNIYTKKFNLDLLKYLDFCAVIVPFCHMIGRIGCFYGKCCYGIPVDENCFLGFDFNNDGNYYLATQLIESAFNLVLFFLLLTFYNKKHKDGSIAVLYLIIYPVFRFIIEFFRYDERGSILFLSTSQFISIILIIYAIYLVFKIRGKSQDETCNSAS